MKMKRKKKKNSFTSKLTGNCSFRKNNRLFYHINDTMYAFYQILGFIVNRVFQFDVCY